MAIIGSQLRERIEEYLWAEEDLEDHGLVTYGERKLAPSLGLKPRRRRRSRFAPHIPFLTSELIKKLIEEDQLIIDPPPSPHQIREATLELRAGFNIYESEFDLPTEEHVRKYGKKLPGFENFILKPGLNYYIESLERLSLPRNWEAVSHTKSTYGRLGCMCGALDEKYAKVEGGKELKNVMCLFKPLVFPVIVRPMETPIFQLKISEKGSSYLDRNEIEKAYEKDITLFNEDNEVIPLENVIENNGLKLTLSTEKVFVSKEGDFEPIDLTKKEHYDPNDYFELIKTNREDVLIEPRRLYLCGSNEKVKMGNLIGVLNREDPHIGPGWWTQTSGYTSPGYIGRMTFELYSFGKRIVTHNHPAGKIFLESLSGKVENDYSRLGYYQNQESPRLPKVFKLEGN